MRIARFQSADGRVQHGIVRENGVQVIQGDILGPWTETGQRLPTKEVKLLAPLSPDQQAFNLSAIQSGYGWAL